MPLVREVDFSSACQLLVDDPTDTSPHSLQDTVRHTAALGKKRATGLDGFGEFFYLTAGQRTAHNAGVMMVSKLCSRLCV